MTSVFARTSCAGARFRSSGFVSGIRGWAACSMGMVAAAPMPMHGRVSHVRHVGHGLFAGIPQDFSVVRYHSLAVTGPISPDGRVTAWTEDGVMMGIEHRHRPMWGVQFHPESISTEYGHALIENFYALARHHKPPSSPGVKKLVTPSQSPPVRSAARRRCELHVRSLDGEPSTELIFERLFGDSDYAFWLDSADAPTRLAQCSYLGTTMGADRCRAGIRRGAVGCDGPPRRLQRRLSMARSSICWSASWRAARSSRRRSWRAACSAASSAIWAMSARRTVARATCIARTCPTR